MIHLIGYAALGLNLASMAMKSVFHLRALSLMANLIYLVYGIVLNAPPFIVGCGVAVIIHAFHIVRLRRSKLISDEKNGTHKSL
ncbi:MAG: hypothetical protein AAFX55_10615 [Bacteroidota bacterium]